MAYAYYRTVTVDHTKVGSSDLTDFSVVISVIDNAFKTTGNSGHIQNATTSLGQTVPADLCFFVAGTGLTTKLDFEVAYWNGSLGVLVAWIRLPSVSHTVDTVFNLAYDDPSVTTFQGNVSGTWSVDYEGVWHFPDGVSLSLLDSTANGYNGTNGGATPAGSIAGGVGGGSVHFTSLFSQHATVTGLTNLGFTNGTISWWQLMASTYNDGIWASPWGQLDTGTNDEFVFQKYIDNNLYIGWLVGGSDKRVIVAADPTNWPHNAAVKYDLVWTVGGLTTLYVNGGSNAVNSGGTSLGNIGQPLTFGQRGGTPIYFDGYLDEFRVRSVAASVDWLTAEYNNQVSPSTFAVLGAETPVSAGRLFRLANLSGLQGGGPFFINPIG